MVFDKSLYLLEAAELAITELTFNSDMPQPSQAQVKTVLKEWLLDTYVLPPSQVS